MKIRAKVGPMILVEVKQIHIIETYYRIILDEARLTVTNLHAFKVINNEKSFLATPSQLKKGNLIWVDEFLADGSLITRSKNEIFNTSPDTCISNNGK
jgi:hypothetical protein